MWIWIAVIAGTPVGLALVWFLFLIVVMRTGYAPGLAVVRRFNRRVTNRQVLKTAGGAGASASVIRHIGRSSGKSYETPVGVTEAGENFLISLPYGTTPDWLKNVRAAGTAEIVHGGIVFRASAPELVDAASVARYQSRQERLGQWIFGVDQVLRLRVAPVGR
ncbi:nitroreductase family deazaflavin-dependent oxidoreductase [Nocardia huaxiensis]|uniref:Nitroreductase family deazaflavin-dependent oxidoreductase n=1 Tax=Nocardia huaxiensis TaxID=2755382 RepID=A0A7D6ZEL3_9NOCA|nr:nitroreductase family deazaflavin-dependent oxidoreductase [Nocardia huaxiensis]QLY28347.1 nitroreductase family deazaflavin-dependent oxidoreductase [Nocardia huaxiensis]UFS98207.1 nitroreductase family deazaflavin-dependent oxidoreductase [Nocardia huaxiensis]